MSGAIAATFAATFLFFAASASYAALLGDLDGDGRVTLRDVVRLVGIVHGHETPRALDQLLGHFSPNQNAVTLGWRGSSFGDTDIRLALRTVTGLVPAVDIGAVVYTFGGSGDPDFQLPEERQYVPVEAAILSHPYDMTFDREGASYFTEFVGNRIRTIGPYHVVRTLAGNLLPGFVDGPADTARFFHPEGIAALPDGSLVVADTGNHSIRKISPDGTVMTLAGDGHPGSGDGRGPNAHFFEPNGVAAGPNGSVFVADTLNNLIREIAPDGTVTTLAGDGRHGLVDGPSRAARLSGPAGVLYDPRDGGLFIADTENNAVRKLTAAGEIITLAGQPKPGHVDGIKSAARFKRPYGLELDCLGRLLIADWGNESVRRLDPDGRVVTVAGRLPAGYTDGYGTNVHFRGLMNVRIGPDGRTYVLDTDNERIRVLVP